MKPLQKALAVVVAISLMVQADNAWADGWQKRGHVVVENHYVDSYRGGHWRDNRHDFRRDRRHGHRHHNRHSHLIGKSVAAVAITGAAVVGGIVAALTLGRGGRGRGGRR